MIDSSSGERTSSFQSPTIIAIIPISNLPFPVLVVAPAHGSEQVFEGELNRGDGDFDMVYGDGLTTREGKRFEIAFWSTPTQG